MAEPKIRFSKFGDKWNEIPLNNFLYENKDRNKDEKFTKEDVLSVSGEYGVVNQIALQGRSFAGESVAPYHVVNTGDVIYTKSPLKANPYGIIKYNSGVPGIVSTLYAVYHCKNNVDGKFVELYFSNDYRLNKYLKPLVNIGAKHDMKVSNEHAISGLVTFPSLEEQKAIVSTFSAVEDIIFTLTEEVRLWEEKKKGVMQKIFSQEVRFKDENGDDYPEWEEVKLKDVADFLPGLTYKPENVVDDNTKTLVLRSSNVQGGRITYHDNVYVDMEIPSRIFVKENDTLMCVRNGSKHLVGKSALITNNDLGNSWGAFMTVIRSHESNTFIHHYLNSDAFYKQMFPDLSTSTIGQITKGMLDSCELQYPCLAEQQKIADCLSSIDEVIAIKKQKLETWKNIKKGLLQQMFV